MRDFTTDVYLDDEDVKRLCRPGSADTCIWLVMAPGGWECVYFNRPDGLQDRFDRGETNAKRDGCDEIEPAFAVAKRAYPNE